jgi:hypothetical protein
MSRNQATSGSEASMSNPRSNSPLGAACRVGVAQLELLLFEGGRLHRELRVTSPAEPPQTAARPEGRQGLGSAMMRSQPKAPFFAIASSRALAIRRRELYIRAVNDFR